MKKIKAGLPHGLAFVSDPQAGEPPEPGLDDEPVWANSECLMIKCTHVQEGETDIMLSKDASDAMPQTPIFDGTLNTPSRVVQIWTSMQDILLEIDVPTQSTRMRVWTNHPRWADVILIVAG
jgi:hypothetical protein